MFSLTTLLLGLVLSIVATGMKSTVHECRGQLLKYYCFYNNILSEFSHADCFRSMVNDIYRKIPVISPGLIQLRKGFFS